MAGETTVSSLNWSLLLCSLENQGQVYCSPFSPHINISFVCGSFCFVLHVASKGDKARVIWSAMKRTEKWFLAGPAVLKGKSLVYLEVKYTVTDLIALSIYLHNLDYIWKPIYFLTLYFLTNIGFFISSGLCSKVFIATTQKNYPFGYVLGNVLL